MKLLPKKETTALKAHQSRPGAREFPIAKPEILRREAKAERLRCQESMAGWLSGRPWQAFMTGTFRWQTRWNRNRQAWEDQPLTDLRRAKKVFAEFRHLLNKRYCGKHYARRRCKLFVFEAIEYQKRGALHAHWLIGGMPENWRYKHLREDWETAQRTVGLVPGKGWVKSYPKGSGPGGEKLSLYVTKLAKYVVKDDSAELWNYYGDEQSDLRRPSWIIIPGAPFEKQERRLQGVREQSRQRAEKLTRALEKLQAKARRW